MKKKGLYNSSSCIGFKCKKLNKSALKFYNTKHKFTPSCFNTCVDWTLNVSFLHDKVNYSNKIKGNNLFFRTLEKSALNELTAQGGLKHKNIYESPTFSDLSNSQLKNVNENFDELLNIKFPINNKTFNYMIIDANLAIFLKLLREINHPDREIFFVLNGTIHGINLFTSELKFSVEQRKFIKSIKFKLDTYKKDLINQKMQHPNSPDKLKIKNTFFAKLLTNTNIGIEFSKPRFDMHNPEKFQTNFNSIVNSKVNINKIFLEVSIPKSFLCSNNYLTIIDDKIEENEKEIPDIQLDKFNDNISNDKTATSSFNINNTNTNSNINNNTGYNSPTTNTFENMMNNNNIYSKSSLRNKQINIPSLNQNFNLNFLNIKNHLYNSPHLGYSYPKFLHHQQQQNIMTPDNLSLLFGGGRSLNNNNTMNNINNSTFSSSIHFSPNFGVNNFNSYLPVSPGGRSYIGTNNQIMFNNLGNNNGNNNKISYANIPPFELDPNNSMLSRYSENSLFSESYNNNNINSPRSVIDYPSNYYNAGFSNINNFGMFNNNQSHLSVRSFGRGSFYKGHNMLNNMNNISFNLNVNNGYMSPRNVSNLNFTNLNISEDKKIFNGVPTIKKKIMDWENSNGKKEENKEVNKEENNKIESNEEKTNNLNNHANIFVDYYENSCNYIIFLRNSSTYLNKKDINSYKDISLDRFFKSFQKVSLSGLKINYLTNKTNNEQFNISNANNNKHISIINYSLTLSSFEISFNDKEIILNIIDYLISINKCNNQIKAKIEENYIKDQLININNINNLMAINNNYMEFFPLEKNQELKIILKGYSKISIEFNENKPPHLRKNFYHQMKEIINILNISNISINNISGTSYFSIRYTPYNCRSKNNIQTSFVNYYQFKLNEERNIFSNKYIDIPLIGILPLKFNHIFFLEKINKECYNSNNISDIMIVNRLIQNVTNNFIKNNNGGNSIDVEYYLNQQININ